MILVQLDKDATHGWGGCHILLVVNHHKLTALIWTCFSVSSSSSRKVSGLTPTEVFALATPTQWTWSLMCIAARDAEHGPGVP
jgi:hypothetical protein